MFNNYCRSVFTLQGSQPYVLTANWSKGFTPNMTYWTPDLSMENVSGYNTNNYHPIHFNERLISKKIETPKSFYNYEMKQ